MKKVHRIGRDKIFWFQMVFDDQTFSKYQIEPFSITVIITIAIIVTISYGAGSTQSAETAMTLLYTASYL